MDYIGVNILLVYRGSPYNEIMKSFNVEIFEDVNDTRNKDFEVEIKPIENIFILQPFIRVTILHFVGKGYYINNNKLFCKLMLLILVT